MIQILSVYNVFNLTRSEPPDDMYQEKIYNKFSFDLDVIYNDEFSVTDHFSSKSNTHIQQCIKVSILSDFKCIFMYINNCDTMNQ